MSPVSENILLVEEKWLTPLTEYSGQMFRSVWIPSHDEIHSHRVWSFAKELYRELEKEKIITDPLKLEQTLIAVFFHDMGMTRDPGPEHGKLSREMCLDFFKHTGLDKPIGFNVILDAIVNHDDKTYRNHVNQSAERFSVFEVLCISDDLDAFGLTGIFRYWEIYKLRGIPEKLIPGKVLQNLEDRFTHFKEDCSFLHHFYRSHRNRFLKTKQFYTHLQEAYTLSPGEPPLSTRIIEIFNRKILEEHVYPVDLLKELKGKQSPEVLRFIKEFRKEFSS